MYQYWELSNAAITLPFNFQRDMYRWECLYSAKGGKRPFDDSRDLYKNPCFNVVSNDCVVNHNETMNDELNTTTCNVNHVPKYINDTRDCEYGKRSTCTKNSPCVPCGMKYKKEFGDRWKRCKSCSEERYKNSCNFVKGVGPYCFKSATSRDVIPCVECCTKAIPIFVNGTCY